MAHTETHNHHPHDHHGRNNHDDGNGHGHSHSHHDLRHASQRSLLIALGLTVCFMVVEVAGALIGGSLDLLADGVHMIGDVGSIGLALAAMWVATHPALLRRTFGYYRAEMIAAFINALTMIAIAVWIFFEAEHRLASGTTEYEGGLTLIVGTIGLFFNLAALWVLRHPADTNLNVAGAYVHVLGDTLSSVGVIIAALLAIWFGWHIADPIISIIIGILILISTIKLLWEVVRVLLQGTPRHIDMAALTRRLKNVEGVENAHNVSAWTVTPGMDVFSAHIALTDSHSRMLNQNQAWTAALLEELRGIVRDEFGIEHVTFQIEESDAAYGEDDAYNLYISIRVLEEMDDMLDQPDTDIRRYQHEEEHRHSHTHTSG